MSLLPVSIPYFPPTDSFNTDEQHLLLLPLNSQKSTQYLHQLLLGLLSTVHPMTTQFSNSVKHITLLWSLRPQRLLRISIIVVITSLIRKLDTQSCTFLFHRACSAFFPPVCYAGMSVLCPQSGGKKLL